MNPSHTLATAVLMSPGFQLIIKFKALVKIVFEYQKVIQVKNCNVQGSCLFIEFPLDQSSGQADQSGDIMITIGSGECADNGTKLE